MTTIDLSKIGEFLIKNGSKGVLVVWVAMQQIQINQIREEYKDCMNNRVEENRLRYPIHQPLAILPESIRIQQWDEKQPRKS